MNSQSTILEITWISIQNTWLDIWTFLTCGQWTLNRQYETIKKTLNRMSGPPKGKEDERGSCDANQGRTKLDGESEKYAKGTKINKCRVQRKARQQAGESSDKLHREIFRGHVECMVEGDKAWQGRELRGYCPMIFKCTLDSPVRYVAADSLFFICVRATLRLVTPYLLSCLSMLSRLPICKLWKLHHLSQPILHRRSQVTPCNTLIAPVRSG